MNIDFCNKEMQIGYADICKDCFMNQKYELTGTISFYWSTLKAFSVAPAEGEQF